MLEGVSRQCKHGCSSPSRLLPQPFVVLNISCVPRGQGVASGVGTRPFAGLCGVHDWRKCSDALRGPSGVVARGCPPLSGLHSTRPPESTGR